MLLNKLLDQWADDREFISITRAAAADPGYRATVTGLDGSSRVYLMAALAARVNRSSLIVAADMARAEKIYEDLLAFFHPDMVKMLPPRELFSTAGILTQSAEQRQQRLSFLQWLYRRGEGIYVAPFTALITRVIPPGMWQDLVLELHTGKSTERDQLLSKLLELGYERTPLIERRGQFSARGEIVDIYPQGFDHPLRMELNDDCIESLRLFNLESQRSTANLSEAAVMPAHELVLPETVFRSGENAVRQDIDRVVAELRSRGEKEMAARVKTNAEQHLIKLLEPGSLELLPGYFSYFYGEGANLVDYLPPEFLIMADDASGIQEKSALLYRELEEHSRNAYLQGELLPGQLESFWEIGELFRRPPCPLVACNQFSFDISGFEPDDQVHFAVKGVAHYHGQWELLRSDIRALVRDGYRICMLAGSPERGKGLLNNFAETGLTIADRLQQPWNDNAGAIQMTTAVLEESFIIPSLELAVIAEQNLIPRHKKKKKRLSTREGVRLSDYRDLAVGDYVVHEQHGIGKYLGVSTLELRGVQRDYLLVKYSGTDKLYIPVDQIDLIQKYVGADGKAPRLHSLGSGEWQRLKSKVKESVRELAGELLALYAARQANRGYSFEKDHPWQLEFETRFPYEETPDQLQVIDEVKKDLEKPQPMDRLVCGDVGYGKTEVALRAAFKVTMEGKQVALLVPTTVLAQQHFRTFSERFSDFPIKIGQLSRFVTPAKQKEALRELELGKIDIIIATHRLLSKDVRFHDLGLLIIDEEQRFGVKHKEKLKQMRLDVDVLAMTATPIPRTLHLSLAGARDLSVMDTPPENRYPVQTFVVEYSENLIREAIYREFNRQGQVYFVFNRVEGINSMARRIRELFPDVPVAVAHGQMSEVSLEQIMNDFLDGRYRVLVSTTIIEAGLDIPNVNTLIVFDADRFGLAQLYQLRGRVGRSNRLAYAYLTYRRDRIISETARKRLQAIKEFTELGSGLKVALRDLEIRGAGNILGAEQHGFMVAVGFDLYCRLLEQAVARLKGEKKERLPDPRFELKVNAYLPASYIPNQEQKIRLYQRIYTLDEDDELKEVRDELADRYGSPPLPVKNLLLVAHLRVLSRRLGVELVRQQKNLAIVQFGPTALPVQNALRDITGSARGRITLVAGEPLRIKVKLEDEAPLFLYGLIEILQEILRSYGEHSRQSLA